MTSSAGRSPSNGSPSPARAASRTSWVISLTSRPGRHLQGLHRIGRGPPVRFLSAEARDVHRQLKLVDPMATDARERDLGPAEDDGACGPGIRANPGERELDRQVVRVLLDEGVHPVRVGGEDLLALGMVARPLGCVPRSAEHHQPGSRVVLERLGPEDLGEASFVPAPPHLHLPEPVLGGHVALSEEEVMGVPGVDVGDSPLVAENLHGVLQPRHGEIALYPGERLAGQFLERLQGPRLPRALWRSLSSGESGRRNTRLVVRAVDTGPHQRKRAQNLTG